MLLNDRLFPPLLILGFCIFSQPLERLNQPDAFTANFATRSICRHRDARRLCRQ